MTIHTIAVTHCARCGNELTFAEYRAKQGYCTPCQRALDDYERRLGVATVLDRANRKVACFKSGSI